MKGLLFTYALTYGGALVSLVRPFHGLLIYICFAIIRPTSLWHWSVPSDGSYSRIVAIALLVGWLMNGLGEWRLGKGAAMVVAFLGFFGWAIVSATTAVADSSLAFGQVEEYAKILLPFLVGMTMIHSPRQVKQLAWVLVLSHGYLAYEFNLMYYTSPFFDPNDWMFAGLDRNGIAITMVTAAGLAFFLGLDAVRSWQRWLCFALAGLMVHVVLFSMSRGGMLAVVATGVVSFVLIPKRPKTVAVFALAIVVGLSLAGPAVVERFQHTFEDEKDRDASAQGRVELWSACAGVIMAEPVTGIGPLNWRLVAHNYGFPVGKDAHSMWLHVGAEMGVPGLAFLVAFYGLCIFRLWPLARARRKDVDEWTATVARMTIAALAGFAVSAQFVSVQGVELPYYIVLLGAATLKLRSLGVRDASARGLRQISHVASGRRPSPTGVMPRLTGVS